MATFQIKSIITLENHFRRERVLGKEELKGAISNMDIGIAKEIKNEKEFTVTLEVNVVQKFNDKVLFEGSSIMLGTFGIDGEPSGEVVDNFSRINGPAILFPYIREYFSSTSLKCGLAPILIPPVNFVENDRLEREKGNNFLME